MKNIQEDTRLVEEISELNETKTNTSDSNKKEITLIFRNPSSKDTTLNCFNNLFVAVFKSKANEAYFWNLGNLSISIVCKSLHM